MTRNTKSQIASRIPLKFRKVGHPESRLPLEQYHISAIRVKSNNIKAVSGALKPQI